MWDIKITFNRGLPFNTSSVLDLDDVLDSVKTVFLEPPESRKIVELLISLATKKGGNHEKTFRGA